MSGQSASASADGSNDTECYAAGVCLPDACPGESMLTVSEQQVLEQFSSKKEPSISMISSTDIQGVLNSDFRIQRLLGRGRKGYVYELFRPRNKGTYAGKIFVESKDCNNTVVAEAKLADWAYKRNLAPQVINVLHGRASQDEVASKPLLSVLVMEKMDMSLSRVMEYSYGFACRSWNMAYALLTTGDLRPDEYLREASKKLGWMCCDDMKPDNILVNASKGVLEPSTLVLTDWDPDHWHSLPLCPEDGQYLNRFILSVNTILCHSGNTQWLIAAINCWPDHQITVLKALYCLSKVRDPQLLKFLKAYDNIFSKGPYHYAGVHSVNKKLRARDFAGIFHIRCATCIGRADEESTVDIQDLKIQLRKLRVRYLRASMIKNSGLAKEE